MNDWLKTLNMLDTDQKLIESIDKVTEKFQHY